MSLSAIPASVLGGILWQQGFMVEVLLLPVILEALITMPILLTIPDTLVQNQTISRSIDRSSFNSKRRLIHSYHHERGVFVLSFDRHISCRSTVLPYGIIDTFCATCDVFQHPLSYYIIYKRYGERDVDFWKALRFVHTIMWSLQVLDLIDGIRLLCLSVFSKQSHGCSRICSSLPESSVSWRDFWPAVSL